jgi:hypothetical protein
VAGIRRFQFPLAPLSLVANMEDIHTLRTEELEALQAFYGDQVFSSLSSNPGETLSISGPWFIRLSSSPNKKSFVPTLEIRPSDSYPLDAPTPILHNVDHQLNSSQNSDLINELLEMHEPEMGVCIMWAERCREEFAVDVVENTSSSAAIETVSNEINDLAIMDPLAPIIELAIRFLSYNHLLHGKAHKKEAQIVSAASKMGLVGFVTYGTPGIIGILVSRSNISAGIVTTDADVIDFSKECGLIGKKCAVLDIELNLDADGLKCEKQSGTVNAKSKKKDVSNKTQLKGLYALLVDLLGEDKVACSKQQEISVKKKGLYSFASCAELKRVLVDNQGMDETTFQRIIGVA